MSHGYDFERADLATLLMRKFFPERTQHESAVILDWLSRHGERYDRFSFSVRVGAGVTPDPAHLPGVQRSTVWSSRKRIDVLAYQGDQPTIGEVKLRIGPETLGQLLTYRQLYLEDHPDSPEPKLIAIGRFTDDDTRRVLNDNGIDVFLYEPAGD